MYEIKSKIWIETANGILLSEGRIQLLEHINATGSLNKAAKAMDISYLKAWRLLDSISKASNKPLIVKQKGGQKGGGTQLTDYGKELIASFKKINSDCWKFLDSELNNLPL